MKKIIIAVTASFLFVLACGVDNSEKESSNLKFEHVGGQGKMHFVYVDPAQHPDRSAYKKIARKICSDGNVCIVMFWDNKDLAPRSIPMTDEQLNSKVAHYNVNKNTGLERILICSEDGC